MNDPLSHKDLEFLVGEEEESDPVVTNSPEVVGATKISLFTANQHRGEDFKSRFVVNEENKHE